MESKSVFETFQESSDFAREEITRHNAQLVDSFLKVLEFCFKFPEDTGGVSGVRKFSSRWIQVKAEHFVKERKTKPPKVTELVTDPLIETICTLYFEVQDSGLLIEHHKKGMAAEQVTGSLLEEYIASKIEPIGWVWCTGKMVKATDFIEFPDSSDEKPTLLQIKNRSNSENSSSSAIREGTEIIEWHRMDAVSGNTHWDKIPNVLSKVNVSESDFHEFVKLKIEGWKLL